MLLFTFVAIKNAPAAAIAPSKKVGKNTGPENTTLLGKDLLACHASVKLGAYQAVRRIPDVKWQTKYRTIKAKRKTIHFLTKTPPFNVLRTRRCICFK